MNLIGKQVGVSARTVGRRLKGTKRVRVLKGCPLSDVFDPSNPKDFGKHMVDREGRAWRMLPYIYIDPGYTHKKYRKKIKLKRAKNLLSNKHWEVAKLSAIAKYGEYSERAAEEAIDETGLSKFRKNTKCLENKDYYYSRHSDMVLPETKWKPDLSKYDRNSADCTLK
jgi:16S rRNA G966 N2-methylase RsmD